MTQNFKRLALVMVVSSAIFLLAACADTVATPTETDTDVLLTAQAANPLPTQMSGDRVAASSICLNQQFVTVGVDSDYLTTTQGDMLAWNPTRDALAYVSPENGRWGWFVGNLVVYDFGLKKDTFSTNDVEVMGDITWSPDGSNIAYVVLDPSEKTYTVYVGGLANSLSVDIFGSSAKTDDYSSAKGILDWTSDRNVVVTSSCGLDCSQQYNYNTETSVLTKDKQTRKNEDPSLSLTNETTSPNGRWTVAADEKNNVWLSDSKTKKASVISTGDAVQEIKWSVDSRFLALRFSGSIKVFDTKCIK